MAKFTYSHNNFTSGQLSKRLAGRIDLTEYANGCDTLENMIPFKQGGVIRRPGSQLFKYPNSDNSDTDFDNDNIFMLPFMYSKTSCYVFVIDVGNNGVVRCYNNSGSDLTLSGFVTGSWSSFGGISSTLDVYGFDWVQTGYYLVLVHNSGLMSPKLISPTFDTSGGISGLVLSEFTLNFYEVPYLSTNATTTTLTPGTTALGASTLTASTSLFNENHVGAYFMVRHSTQWGIAYVTAYTSATLVSTINVIPFGDTTASDTWRESAWSAVQGYPKTVSMYEARIVFGATLTKPDTIWFSMTANIKFLMQQRLGVAPSGFASYITDYIGDAEATDPTTKGLAGDQANVIAWIIPGRSLHVGTIGEEYLVSFDGDTVDATSILSSRALTAYGSSPIKPTKMNDMSVFVTRDSKRLRSIVYTEENGSFTSSDLNIVADDVFDYKVPSTSNSYNVQVKQIAFHSSRNIVWALTSENYLVGVTLSEDGSVFAWHSHYLGGYSNSDGDPAKVMGIMVLPNDSGTWDDLYMVVKRYINEETVYYIERMGADFTGDETDGSSSGIPVMLDGASSQPAPTTTTIPNLTRFIGEELSVIADGEYIGDYTVDDSGEITLEDIYSNYVTTGYKYTSTLKTMDLEAGEDYGVSMGLMKRIDRAFIKFHKTRKANIGTTTDNLLPIDFTSSTILFTGSKKLVINNTPGEAGSVIITQEEPYPMSVLAIALRGKTYD